MDQDNPEHRKYMIVASTLKEEIRTGLRVPGDRLPSIADLCQTWRFPANRRESDECARSPGADLPASWPWLVRRGRPLRLPCVP